MYSFVGAEQSRLQRSTRPMFQISLTGFVFRYLRPDFFSRVSNIEFVSPAGEDPPDFTARPILRLEPQNGQVM
jgi:hypothetical protein